MVASGPQKTVFAQLSFDLTDTLRERFAGFSVEGAVPRTVHFLAPEVETTGGGKQARQSIQLLASNPQTHPPLVCGFIDVGSGMAHLRSHKSLQSLALARHGIELALDAASYQAFLDVVTRELAAQRIIAKITQETFQTDQPPAPRHQQQASRGASQDLVMLALGAIIGVCVGALLWAPFSPIHGKKGPVPVVTAPAQ